METVKLKVPAGAGNVSFEGTEYVAAKDGTIDVPAGAVACLAQYGYEPVPAESGKKAAHKGRDATADTA